MTKHLPLTDSRFLEFYGILLGDGWISRFKAKHHRDYNLHWIGITGNIHEEDYLLNHVIELIRSVSDSKIMIKRRTNDNALELVFNDKWLALALNEELFFPIGLKHDLMVRPDILSDWTRLKHVLRGLFDTDGTIYFDRAKGYARPYPIVELNMNEPKLIKQIITQLKKQRYHVTVSRNRSRLRLKGFSQVNRWFTEVKPYNNKHLIKYVKYVAPVAQLG